MKYKVFIDDLLIPTPGEIAVKVKNKNKTMTLINEGEVNILKSAGLTEFDFKYIDPHGRTVDKLTSLKEAKKPFFLKIVRPSVFDTEMLVSLEDFSFKDVDKHIRDQVVSVKFKQYRDYKTKTLTIIDENTASVEKPREEESSPKPKGELKTHIVKSGDTLWALAKKYYDDGSLYNKIAEANNIDKPNLINQGAKLKIPVLS